MSWELDHVFFADASSHSAEAAFAKFGIAFTRHRIHHGQGTANACAVFENAFFEVLFPHDLVELRSEIVKPLGLEERIHWRESGACPFGVCFRPSGDLGSASSLPFPTWQYAARYLPKGMTMPIVTPHDRLSEPLLFILPWPSSAISSRQDLSHRGVIRRLSHVEMQCVDDVSRMSAGVRWFAQKEFFSLTEGREFLLVLEWDHAREGRMHSFAPRLPILLSW